MSASMHWGHFLSRRRFYLSLSCIDIPFSDTAATVSYRSEFFSGYANVFGQKNVTILGPPSHAMYSKRIGGKRSEKCGKRALDCNFYHVEAEFVNFMWPPVKAKGSLSERRAKLRELAGGPVVAGCCCWTAITQRPCYSRFIVTSLFVGCNVATFCRRAICVSKFALLCFLFVRDFPSFLFRLPCLIHDKSGVSLSASYPWSLQ